MNKKTKFDEMFERLPENIKEDSILSLESKKVLAALLELLLNSKANETGVIYANNSLLRRLSGISSNRLLDAIRQLKEYGLINRKSGKGKGIASEYSINFNRLKEPIKKPSFDELFGKFFDDVKSSENRINTTTTIPITNTITKTNSISKTITKAIKKTNSIENKN